MTHAIAKWLSKHRKWLSHVGSEARRVCRLRRMHIGLVRGAQVCAWLDRLAGCLVQVMGQWVHHLGWWITFTYTHTHSIPMLSIGVHSAWTQMTKPDRTEPPSPTAPKSSLFKTHHPICLGFATLHESSRPLYCGITAAWPDHPVVPHRNPAPRATPSLHLALGLPRSMPLNP
jgi:hypothetical protein